MVSFELIRRQKQELREAMKKVLTSTHVAAHLDSYSQRMRVRLANWLKNGAAHNSLHIGLYASMPHEIELLPLIHEQPQWHYYAPRCYPRHEMEFHQVRSESELELSPLGVREPHHGAPIIPPEQLNVIIVPGLAFNVRHDRLGYGGGYYDRYLTRAIHAKRISVCLPDQVIDHIPTDARYDLRIDELIYESF